MGLFHFIKFENLKFDFLIDCKHDPNRKFQDSQ